MIPNLCFFGFVLLFSAQFCTSVRATTPTPTSGIDKDEVKIICHYHLHTWYTPGYRDYSPEVIDESQCTHIVYNDRVRYADLSANRSLHDGKKLFYGRVPEFRKKGINVSISFFKFNAYEYARTLGDNDERARFVASLVAFIEQNHFNGFDLFWGCRSCSKDDSQDVQQDERFMDLMRQLSEAFRPRGWLLSTAIRKDVYHVDFNVQKLSEYVDWMTVMPISSSGKNTELYMPLYFYEGDQSQELTVNWSINYFIEQGVPSRKIVLPTASLGQTYELVSAPENGLNAPTKQRYTSHFHEICNNIIQNSWEVVHDSSKRVGSYAFYNDQWTSYNDVEDVQRKAEYIIEKNLGGGSFMKLNYDDFEDKCGCGKNPLLKALVQVLRGLADPKSKNCT